MSTHEDDTLEVWLRGALDEASIPRGLEVDAEEVAARGRRVVRRRRVAVGAAASVAAVLAVGGLVVGAEQRAGVTPPASSVPTIPAALGYDWQGWEGAPDARCEGDDRALLVARTAYLRIVVCERDSSEGPVLRWSGADGRGAMNETARSGEGWRGTSGGRDLRRPA